MNKAQIKAELRRSACEDECVIFGVELFGEIATFQFRGPWENETTDDVWRTFFLLVAEAL